MRWEAREHSRQETIRWGRQFLAPPPQLDFKEHSQFDPRHEHRQESDTHSV